MKIAFEASNSIEAHLVLGLLKQANIDGMVSGEYLQGGVGELPVFGLVNVMVRDEDYENAKEVIATWYESSSG